MYKLLHCSLPPEGAHHPLTSHVTDCCCPYQHKHQWLPVWCWSVGQHSLISEATLNLLPIMHLFLLWALSKRLCNPHPPLRGQEGISKAMQRAATLFPLVCLFKRQSVLPFPSRREGAGDTWHLSQTGFKGWCWHLQNSNAALKYSASLQLRLYIHTHIHMCMYVYIHTNIIYIYIYWI